MAGVACATAWPAPVAATAPYVELAQRVIRPGEPPPPAPDPPPIQPRTGVSEPPQPGKAGSPAATPQANKPRVTPTPAFEPVRVTFAEDSASLGPDARAKLDKLAATLKGNATVRVMVTAHTSTRASVSETRRLSLQRGTAVRTYLVNKGFPAARIDLQPLGASPDDGPRDRVDVTPGR
jgi:OOP family OmpA-OmpF porin